MEASNWGSSGLAGNKLWRDPKKIIYVLVPSKLQHVLHGAILEDHLKATAGWKCSVGSMGFFHYAHVSTLLYKLHWLPVGFKMQFKMQVKTCKALHGMGPDYLSSLISSHSGQSGRIGMSRCLQLNVILQTQEVRLLCWGFALWNSSSSSPRDMYSFHACNLMAMCQSGVRGCLWK